MTNTPQSDDAASTLPSEPAAPAVPLPTAATLAKATGLALLVATVLLVLVVLPSEYGVDPTGFGEAVGLTQLSAAADDVADEAAAPAAEGGREDSVVIEVPAGEGLEYKFILKAGEKLVYSWEVEGGSLFFDFHGEPKGDTTGFFESYVVSTASETRGTFTAPFEGSHGWYWKNRGFNPAKVTLVTSGSYAILGLR